MTEERRIQLVAEVDATGTRAGFQEIERQAGTMSNAVAQRSRQTEAAVAGIGGGAGRSAAQIESAGRNLIGSIQRQTAAMEAGSRSGAAYYEVLARQRGVDPAVLAPYLAQLREVEAEQKRVAAATREAEIVQTRANAATAGAAAPLQRIGVSAAQTAAALRGVPAQMTDIVTSLQGGQAPLTVLLQQGGQLKDMFGGAGNAAKALGGYVLGLVNPFTVAIAAVAGLAYLYHEGAAEAKEFNRAIALSGNAAGTTSGQLSDMARNISRAVGTQGLAAEAITALVSTGKVSASNIEQFSTVAIRGQRALGQSVADTAQEFADLAKSPVASLEKLNDKYHFLTGSVYEQVRALTEQGRAYEAGQVAQQAFATGFDGVSTKLIANLGTIERAVLTGKDAWKKFWDSALNVGREDSLEAQLAAIQKRLENSGPAKFPNGVTGVRKDERDADTKEETRLKNLIALEATKSSLAADQARFNAADLEWSKTKLQNVSRAKQLENELTAAREKGIEAGRSDAEIDEVLAGVRKKYADIYNDGIDSNIAALKRRAAVEDLLSRRALNQIGFEKSAGMIDEEKAIERTTTAELTAFDKRRASMVAELALIRQKQNSKTAAADKQGEIDALEIERGTRVKQGKDELFLLEQKQYRLAAENAANLFDQSLAERAGLAAQVREQLDYNETIGKTAVEILNLTAARREELAVRKDQDANIAEGLDLTGEKAEGYRREAAALRERTAAERAGFVKQRDPWLNLQMSVKKYGDEASNVGAQIGDAMTNAFKSAEDAFVGFVTTGKISFSSLATSILADLARIQAKKAIAGLIDMAIGSFGGVSDAQVATSHTDEMSRILGQLSGARASGGPVTGGASYLVGEKGPEIFTPSGSGNIIPNSQIGGGGGGSITIQTFVSAGATDSKASGTGGDDVRGAADALNAKIRQMIAGEMRQGGLLWNMQQGRA